MQYRLAPSIRPSPNKYPYIYGPFFTYLTYVAIAIRNGTIYPLKLYTVKVKKSKMTTILGITELMTHIPKKGKVEARM